MKLSTRTRYGTRAMVELGLAYPGGAISARRLAERQQLPVKYLEHIMAALKATGVVKPVRGAHGGYKLARPPEDIKLIEVYRALEGSPALANCVESPDTCPMSENCATRDTWSELTTALETVLETTTLQHLVDKRTRVKRRTGGIRHTPASARTTRVGVEGGT
jgi:Rrf2 family cysteine metabolism transcriptional repressor